MADYKRIAEHWNEVFGKTETGQIKTTDVGHDDLNKALDWLCFNSESIIDFGCGIGVMLFKCCLRGTKIHKGIDISDKGIRVAMELQRINNFEGFTFTAGGVEELDKIVDDSFDGAILANIIDNLFPEDAVKVLAEIKRILRTGGKILLKLNPYLTYEKLKNGI